MLSPSDKSKIDALGDVAALRHKLDKRQRAVFDDLTSQLALTMKDAADKLSVLTVAEHFKVETAAAEWLEMCVRQAHESVARIIKAQGLSVDNRMDDPI